MTSPTRLRQRVVAIATDSYDVLGRRARAGPRAHADARRRPGVVGVVAHPGRRAGGSSARSCRRVRRPGRRARAGQHRRSAVELPAGRPEGEETLEETLRRELREEACVEVLTARLLGYTRGKCVQGREQGLVLVRSVWRADVRILAWEPELEIEHRLVVPAALGAPLRPLPRRGRDADPPARPGRGGPGALSPDLPQSTSGTFSTAAGKPCWMPHATAWARLTASILR